MKSIFTYFFVAVILFLLPSYKSYGQFMCIDSALSFNGNQQYVNLSPKEISTGNFLPALTNDYTIECLIKWNGGADFQRIFDFNYGANFFMFLTPSEGTNHVPRFAISTTGLSAPQFVDANIPLITGEYHHIAITYSKTQSLLNIFIDGNNVGSGTITIDADSVYHGDDNHDTSLNYIGLSAFPQDPQLDGVIDEFRISNVVRYTDAFVPAVPFTPDVNTVALYHFNDGSGDLATDASGNGYNAELGSTPEADNNDPLWVSCGSVLATSIPGFKAALNNGTVKLSWQPGISLNTDHFIIERSTDGMHYKTIGQTKASSANYTYSFTDMSPLPNNNFYRLKQVDVNGSYQYSNTILITISNGFKLYPTIARSSIHVTVAQLPSTLIIYNASGKRMQTVNINSTGADINISNLPAGIYIIKNATANAYLQFIKQ